ncbi:hypothetical protein [Mesorhizobium sp. M6A.T.Ce.TU.016.01.1.1]|uniref:hypothetical protein n=1 Tax=Mesorhizobium sp. M6A.T.Ce.TU.016.01.1.1 TaxID=2496783 RepID=UPI00163CE9FE|nr:hypothetical protein [Mesorhizobium sp. M6A.T.Ce.TU.016.01.1.1]
MLAAQIANRYPGLVFLQNSDDLLFREAAAFHVLVLWMGQNELQTGLDQRGKVSLTPSCGSKSADREEKRVTYGTVQKKIQEWLDLNDPNQRALQDGMCSKNFIETSQPQITDCSTFQISPLRHSRANARLG